MEKATLQEKRERRFSMVSYCLSSETPTGLLPSTARLEEETKMGNKPEKKSSTLFSTWRNEVYNPIKILF